MTRAKSALLPALTVAAVVLAVQFVSLPDGSRLWRALQDAGHVPAFGLAALALLNLVRALSPQSNERPALTYMLTFGLASALGAGTEFLQIEGPRDASFSDILRDLAGAGGFLALHATSRYSLFGGLQARSVVSRRPLQVAAVALLLAAVAPLAFWSVAFLERDRNFPVIFAADSYWLRALAESKGARLEPAEGSAATLRFVRGTYPGLEIEDLYPDWRGYDSLVVSFTAGPDAPARVALRIDDAGRARQYTDRYQGEWQVQPGVNRWAVALEEIHNAPQTRQMDMGQIVVLIFYSDASAHGTSLTLQQMELK